jgi:DNA polymerase III gamma/tau subunit
MMVLKAGYMNVMLPEEEMTFLKDLMNDISLEEIHRYLSILIHSEEDMKFSSVTRTTLETILLRIISAPRVLDLQNLIQAVSSRAGILPSGHTQQISSVEIYKRPPSSLPLSWEGFISYLKDHDQPLYAIVSSIAVRQDNGDQFVLSCTNQFLSEQLKKALPDLTARAKAFLQKDIVLNVELRDSETTENKKPKPSEVRTQALKSSLVKDIMAEFNGVVKNVKPKE